MKKGILYVLLLFICFAVLIPSVNAKTYTSTSLDLKFDIQSDWELITYNEYTKKLSEPGYGEFQEFMNPDKFKFIIIPKSYNQALTINRAYTENIDKYTINEFGQYLGKKYNSNYTIYKSNDMEYVYLNLPQGDKTYDFYITPIGQYVYLIASNCLNKCLNNNEIEAFIDTIEYDYDAINDNNSKVDKKETANVNDSDSYSYTVEFFDQSLKNVVLKNILVALGGYILILFVAIKLTIDMNKMRKKNQLPSKLSLGWIGIVLQTIALFISKADFWTGNIFEIFYVIGYFFFGLIGLILIYRDYNK